MLACIFLVACHTPTNKEAAQLHILSVEKPAYARGFELQHMSDSSTRIILFDLEHAGDTLDIITWKPKTIERIACLSTTHIAMLQKLNKLNLLKGVGFADLVLNEEAKEKIAGGEIINLTTSHDVDPEIVFSISPEIFFVYPFGSMNYERYAEKNIPCIPISEYLEVHPLGRAEWVKVFGVLLGEEQKAEATFNAITTAYNALIQKANTSATDKPTVFTGFYDSGSWFAPPGNSFAAQFMQDAGANYIFNDSISSSNIIIPFETMLEKTYNADYWGKIVFEKEALTLDRIAEDDKRLTQLKSFKEGKIFYCNAAKTDYHGDAVMQPEVVLEDLIAIFHPDVIAQHAPHYFQLIEQSKAIK